MPVIVTSDPGYEQAMVTVENLRKMANNRVEQLQRQNGVDERSDRSLAEAMHLITALTRMTSQGADHIHRVDHTAGDELLIAMARWHEPCLLSQYTDTQNEDFKRDYNRSGVYVILELVAGKRWIPRYVAAAPKYVGMSHALSQRLKSHAMGSSSNPAEHVMQEWLELNASPAERAAYDNAPDAEQRMLREICISRRRLWVKTAHTEDTVSALQLEKAIIRLYVSQGYELWNKLTYKTTTPY